MECVCCAQVAVAEVEVSPGLEVGMCRDHLARRAEARARADEDARPAALRR